MHVTSCSESAPKNNATTKAHLQGKEKRSSPQRKPSSSLNLTESKSGSTSGSLADNTVAVEAVTPQDENLTFEEVPQSPTQPLPRQPPPPQNLRDQQKHIKDSFEKRKREVLYEQQSSVSRHQSASFTSQRLTESINGRASGFDPDKFRRANEKNTTLRPSRDFSPVADMFKVEDETVKSSETSPSGVDPHRSTQIPENREEHEPRVYSGFQSHHSTSFERQSPNLDVTDESLMDDILGDLSGF